MSSAHFQQSHNQLFASLYDAHAKGKYTEAELLYQRALHIWEQAFGPERPEVAYPLNGLAELHREQGKYVEAEPLYQQALAIREQVLGREHPFTQKVAKNYAALRLAMEHEKPKPLT